MPNTLIISVALRALSDADLIRFKSLEAADAQLAAHPQRRFEQLASRSIRRQLLADYLLVQPDLLAFTQQPHGKPYLKNNKHLEFSQSHCTDQFVLVMNNQGVAVGVDIEAKQRSIKLHALAKRILTPYEFGQFVKATDQQGFLLRIWTIKEAVLKASGLGIRLNLIELESHVDSHVFLKNKVGQVQHTQIGSWAYQCFETTTHYYTVAWQDTSHHPDGFEQVIFKQI